MPRFEEVSRWSARVALVRDRHEVGAPLRVQKRATAPAERQALAREVQVMARWRHPALPVLVDVAADRVTYAHHGGQPLSAWWPHADGKQRRGVVVQVLRVLWFVHRHGYVHGDLKPEHVLVGGGERVSVVDVGLAREIGAHAAGGTHGFLAPELLRGGPCSVSSDLFALGATVASCGVEEPALRDMVARFMAEDPAARPQSAEVALAMLDAVIGEEDERRCATTNADVQADACFAPKIGQQRSIDEVIAIVVEHEPPLLEHLARCWFRAQRPVAALHAHPSQPLLGVAWADLTWGAGTAAALSHLLQRGDLLLDLRAASDLDHAAQEVVDGLAAVQAAAVDLPGRAWVVTDRPLSALPCIRHPGYAVIGGESASKEVLRDSARADHVQPGLVAEAQRALREVPRRMAARAAVLGAVASEDLLSARALLRQQAEPTPAALLLEARILERHAAPDALEVAERAAERVPPGPAAVEAHLVVAAAALPRGLTQRARQACRAARSALAERAPITAPAELIAAWAVAGAPWSSAQWMRWCVEDLEGATPAVTLPSGWLESRVLAHESDVALREGEADAAREAAERALARLGDAPSLAAVRAQALSRIGSAWSLSGRTDRALAMHERALEAAQVAGVLHALAPYVMNLATAQQLAGRWGDAVAGYRRARQLARAFGRQGTEAAALVNLAGLLLELGAHDDVRTILTQARVAARAAGSAIYRVQALLCLAEHRARHDPRRAARWAQRVGRAFEDLGATRQALEASLLAEICAARHGRRTALAARVERALLELSDAGLASRALLALAQAEPNATRALDIATRAAEHAERERDRLVGARAWWVASIAHRVLSTGGHAAAAARAKEMVGTLAATLSAEWRATFLARALDIAVACGTSTEPPTPVRGEDASRAWRLLDLVGRLLREGAEERMLRFAVDEGVLLTGAERAFLLLRSPRGRPRVAVARNLDRETVRQPHFRFSKTVAERVLAGGTTVLTSSATEDPALAGARSILDLKLRSILCVPVRVRDEVIGALYLDHRFENARFTSEDRRLVEALANIFGVALEQARMRRALEERADAIQNAHEQTQRESERRHEEIERLAALVRDARITGGPVDDGGMVGRDPHLLQSLDVARRVAKSTLPVLVLGASGTGKELLARYVHARSPRSDQPFIAINCAAVPEPLLEGELFGYVRGAFSGAVDDRPGLFQAAHGGTLLLDEIGEMPLTMQAKLLRVLQEEEVQRLGARRAERIDVRIVAATHRDLEAAVRQRRFREDLYYRLLGVAITLPPLSARRGDIPLLCDVFLERFAERHGHARRLSRDAMAHLLRHSWPGNVRELEQTLLRGYLLSDGDVIEPQALELRPRVRRRRDALRRFDRELVEQALVSTDGNRTRAAEALGISRVTLHRWIKRHDIRM